MKEYLDDIKKNKTMIEKIIDEYLHVVTVHMNDKNLGAREVKMLQRVETLGINFGHDQPSTPSENAQDDEEMGRRHSTQPTAKNTNTRGWMKEELAKSNKS